MSRERHDGHVLIKDIAKDLQFDQQISGQLCPFCGGGTDKEGSLSVKRISSGALYDCHRASCSASGIVDMNILDAVRRTEVKKHKPNFADQLSYVELPEDIYKLLTTKYRLTKAQIAYAGIRWIPKLKRASFPIKRYMGYPVGIVARSFDANVSPKSLTFLHMPDAPIGSFYVKQRTVPEWWVVEDQLSAIRMSEYVNCVAMCGSHLNESVIADLKTHSVSRLIFAFDGDAFNKALSERKRYEGLFNQISIRKPRCDPKDMTEDALREFVKSS